jgi:DNA invertase Pin-like site-specific DNA recombinase
MFDDRDVSGATLDRPGLTALRAAIRHGEVDVVVVAAVERLADYVADQTALIMEFDQFGVSVEVVPENEAGLAEVERVGVLFRTMLDDWASAERQDPLVREKSAAHGSRLAAAVLDAAGVRGTVHQPIPPRRAGLYVRAASAEARVAQLMTLQAASAGWMVTLIVDDETSGRERDRPSIDLVRDAARSGAIDAVFVTGLDRLAHNARDLASLRDELQAAHCAIVVADATG